MHMHVCTCTYTHAPQASEAELFIALQHLPPLTVLVGDEQQLPPLVKSNEALLAGFDVSTFERLVMSGKAKHTLTVQYRMHPAISQYPSAAFCAPGLGWARVSHAPGDQPYLAASLMCPLNTCHAIDEALQAQARVRGSG